MAETRPRRQQCTSVVRARGQQPQAQSVCATAAGAVRGLVDGAVVWCREDEGIAGGHSRCRAARFAVTLALIHGPGSAWASGTVGDLGVNVGVRGRTGLLSVCSDAG